MGCELFPTFAGRVPTITFGFLLFLQCGGAFSGCGRLCSLRFRGRQSCTLLVGPFLGLSFQLQPVAITTPQRSRRFQLSLYLPFCDLGWVIVLRRLPHVLNKPLLGCGSCIAAFGKIVLFQSVTYSGL